MAIGLVGFNKPTDCGHDGEQKYRGPSKNAGFIFFPEELVIQGGIFENRTL